MPRILDIKRYMEHIKDCLHTSTGVWTLLKSKHIFNLVVRVNIYMYVMLYMYSVVFVRSRRGVALGRCACYPTSLGTVIHVSGAILSNSTSTFILKSFYITVCVIYHGIGFYNINIFP